MATQYLTADYIKVYPAVNSPNDGDINTEYNAKTLAKSSSSRNYLLSGFNFIGSNNTDTLVLGIDTDDSCIRGSFVIDGYFVEIYENLKFNFAPDTQVSDAALVFAVPHYASNTTPDRVKWEKSQHLTGVENGEFQGIRFECVSAKYKNNNQGDYDYNPESYSYTDDPGNNLPKNSLLVGFARYNSSTSKYTENLMGLAMWEYSKLNADDIALSPTNDPTDKSEHRYSSLIPMNLGVNGIKYPHTLSEYLVDINKTFIQKYVNDTKCYSLGFAKDYSYESYMKRSTIRNDDDKLIIDVSLTESRLLKVIGDLTAERVFNAVYNDYAELYKKDDIDEEINPGDVIELNPETGNYRKCKTAKSKLVIGICSDSYGHLIGGDKDKTLEENLQYYIPIGISGRVYANTDDETCEPGDLVMSTNEGKVATYKNVITKINGVLDNDTAGRVLGKCLSKTENGKVLIQIMLG